MAGKADNFRNLLLVRITFTMAMPPGLSNAAPGVIAPNQMRGQMIALYLVCVNFPACPLAPPIVGSMHDYVLGREDAIDLSLASLALPVPKRRPASPHIAPRAAMIAQDFARRRVLVTGIIATPMV